MPGAGRLSPPGALGDDADAQAGPGDPRAIPADAASGAPTVSRRKSPEDGSEAERQVAATVASRLRAARLAAGLSLATVARALEVSPQQLSKYERGRNTLAASDLWLLHRALGVPLDWFYGGAAVSPATDDGVATPVAMGLLEDFARIANPAAQASLAALARALAASMEARSEGEGEQ
jgi:transcriptional regulator with XRE-family HTH domain